MKFTIVFLLGIFASTACAQDATPETGKDAARGAGKDASQDDSKSPYQLLRRFEGDWKTTYSSIAIGSQPAVQHSGSMSSRMLGTFWLVSEIKGNIEGTRFDALQQVGYDEARGKYVGSWTDSVMNHLWQYEGEFDKGGKRLVLRAAGPSFTEEKKTSQYRDMYEIKSEDLITATSQMQDAEGKWVTFMQGELKRSGQQPAKIRVTPFLMFTGEAEAAMKFYTGLLPNSKIDSVIKYGAGEQGKEGTVKQAVFFVAGQRVMCIDSPIKHDFNFTPSVSMFVDCESEQQLSKLFKELSKNGEVMMPLNNYGFSRKFGWVADRYGVSWQLNLPNENPR